MCEPDGIVWIDGSEEEKDRLTQEAVATGEIQLSNQEKLPGCLYHRTAVNDVARTEDLTYICTTLREDAGPTNNWMSPEEGYRRAGEIFQGAMRGRTMYVIPFSMGPVGSPFSKIGVELTDSIYVVLNMRIMTHVGNAGAEAAGDRRRVHQVPAQQGRPGHQAPADPPLPRGQHDLERAAPATAATCCWARSACRCGSPATWASAKAGWPSTCSIMGVENPEGRVEYIAAAFPSACGKTNLAMLVPPEGLKIKGYRIWTVGDDIAWMRIDTDGRLWAINPETGFFGVAPGTNMKTNPSMMKTISRNTIYTNVVLAKDGTVWWEGGEGEPPAEGWDWQGRPWKPGMKDDRRQAGPRRPSQQPLHRAADPVPVGLVPHRAPPRRADLGDHLRRPPGAARPAGLRGLRLGARRVRRGHDGLGADRRPVRQARRGPPRSRWPCSPSAATTWATTSSTG